MVSKETFHLSKLSPLFTIFHCFPLFTFCREVLTQIQMMNADCILHAALEGDRDQVRDQIKVKVRKLSIYRVVSSQICKTLSLGIVINVKFCSLAVSRVRWADPKADNHSRA